METLPRNAEHLNGLTQSMHSEMGQVGKHSEDQLNAKLIEPFSEEENIKIEEERVESNEKMHDEPNGGSLTIEEQNMLPEENARCEEDVRASSE